MIILYWLYLTRQGNGDMAVAVNLQDYWIVFKSNI